MTPWQPYRPPRPAPVRPCGVPGCGFTARHAGPHLADPPPTPATVYCAPTRCYCGACPWWTPRVPPPSTPGFVAAAAAAARAALHRTPDPGAWS